VIADTYLSFIHLFYKNNLNVAFSGPELGIKNYLFGKIDARGVYNLFSD